MLGMRARRPRDEHDDLPPSSELQGAQPRFLADLLIKAEQRASATLTGAAGKPGGVHTSKQKLHSAVAARLPPVALELDVPEGSWPPKLPSLRQSTAQRPVSERPGNAGAGDLGGRRVTTGHVQSPPQARSSPGSPPPRGAISAPPGQQGTIDLSEFDNPRLQQQITSRGGWGVGSTRPPYGGSPSHVRAHTSGHACGSNLLGANETAAPSGIEPPPTAPPEHTGAHRIESPVRRPYNPPTAHMPVGEASGTQRASPRGGRGEGVQIAP